MSKVVLLGDLNVDTVMTIPHFPKPGWDGIAHTAGVYLGGTVVNTAVVLSRLRVSCSLLGSVGCDLWGDFVLKALESAGIDVSAVQCTPEAMTGLTFITVTPDGERTMFSYRGANTRLDLAEGVQHVFDGADVFHLSGYAFLKSPQRDSALYALAIARERGIPICLDSGVNPVAEVPDLFRELLPGISIGVFGLDEALLLFSTSDPQVALRKFLDMGVGRVALKMGEKGCWVADGEGVVFMPAFEVRVVDSTGAGDAFSAGMIWGYLHGLGVQETALLANALGALATTVYGAGLGLPGLEMLITFLREVPLRQEIEPWHDALDRVRTALQEQVDENSSHGMESCGC